MRTMIRFLFVAILCCPCRLLAQWVQTNGPYGGTVTGLAVSGSNILASSHASGMFLSSNNGANWIRTGPIKYIKSLATVSNATGETTLYARLNELYENGRKDWVLLSTDNGCTWASADTSFPQFYQIVRLGTDLFASTTSGIFRSTDNGVKWTVASNGLPDYLFVAAIVVMGTNLFAAVGDSGVFMSTNSGANWTAINSGLPERKIVALAVSPNGTGGTNLFAGTYNGSVFLSTDNGTSWTTANSGLSITDIRGFAVSGSNLFVSSPNRVFLSTNNGAHWKAVDSALHRSEITSMVLMGTFLFVGTSNDGVLLSTDNGASWAPANTGLPCSNVSATAVSGTNLFAGTSDHSLAPDISSGGVFLSTNDGECWSPVNSGLPNSGVNAFAVLPASDGSGGAYLFAATDTGGVFRSNNNGASWIAVNNGLPTSFWSSSRYPEMSALATSSNGTGGTNLFVGILSAYTTINNRGGVYLSTNNGESL